MQSLVVAMGYLEDGWNSSRLWTEQLYAALKAIGFKKAERFAPSLGRPPTWWDRRFAYPLQMPRADLVQLMDQSYGNGLLGLKKSSRSVVLIHDIDFWRCRTWWNAPIRARILSGLGRADRRVVVSEATAKSVREVLGLDVHAVIPPGFDLETFAHQGGARAAKTLLHVGTLVLRKGPDRLIRLIAALPPDWRLTQIGGNWGVEERKLIENLGVASRIEQRGDVGLPDLAKAYARASAFVFPSRYEGFGMPVIEARLVGTRAWVSEGVPAAEHFAGDTGAEVLDFSAFDAGGSETDRRAIVDKITAAKPEAVVFPKRERFTWERAARQFAEVYGGLGLRIP